jgi:hypothetical protein
MRFIISEALCEKLIIRKLFTRKRRSVMAEGKATEFNDEIKRLYEKLNRLKNTYEPMIHGIDGAGGLLNDYELTLPLAEAQILALTPSQRGNIMFAITPALAEIGKEVESGTWKNNLLLIDPAYASLTDLKADIANLVPANDTTIALTNIEKLEALTAVIDTSYEQAGSGSFVYRALAIILGCQAALDDTTSNFNKA